MGFLPEFIFFGNMLLWSLLTLCWFGSLVFLVENKHAGWATFTVAVTLAFLQVCTDFQPLTLAYRHPTTALFCAFLYLSFGIAVGVAKWYLYSNRVSREYVENIEERTVARGASSFDELNDNDKSTVVRGAARTVSEGGTFDIPLKLFQHKVRITTWMTYWPVTAAWTMLNDPIRNFYNWSYHRMGTTLQAISDKAFADIKPEYLKR